MKKQIVSTLLVTITIYFFGLVSSIIVSRYLSVIDRGILNSIFLFISSVVVVSQLGFSKSFIFYKRKYVNNRNSNKIIRTLFFIVVLVSFVFSIGVINKFGFYKNEFLIVPMAILYSAYVFLNSITKQNKNMQLYNISRLTVCFFILLIYVFLIIFKITLSMDVILFVHLTVYFLISTVLYKLVSIKEAKLEESGTSFQYKILFFYTFNSYGSEIFGFIIVNIDKFFILYVSDYFSYGLYVVAFSASRLISIIPHTVSSVIFSKFSGSSSKELQWVSNMSFSILFIPLSFFSIIFSSFSSYILPFIYGEKYIDAAFVFSLLVIECFFSSLSWMLSQRFIATGRPGVIFFRQLLSSFPIIFLVFYMPDYPFIYVITWAVLLSSILRFFLTIMMYPFVLTEEIPPIYPSRKQRILVYNAVFNEKK